MDTIFSRGQDTRQAILSAAFSLFVAHGFHGAFLSQSLALLERFRGELRQLRDPLAQAVMISFFSILLAGFTFAHFSGGSNPPDLDTPLDIFLHGILKAEKL